MSKVARDLTKLVMTMFLVFVSITGARAQSAYEIPALNTQINQLYDQGRYAESAETGERALALAERTLGKEHSDTLTIANNLAVAYKALGRHSEAEQLYKRVLEARERTLGKEHPKTLTCVNNLAELYRTQGRLNEAEPLLQRALAASERVLGVDHLNTLISVDNLGLVYTAQARYAEAETLHRRALEAFERILGSEHPETLASMNNLAQLYGAQGRYAEAERLHRRALEIKERVHGKEHPDTLISVNNLAQVSLALGRYGDAEPLYKRLLGGFERALGPEHPSTLAAINNLAGLYLAQGHYGEAEPLYKRALGSAEPVLGKEHPHTLVLANSLAELYRRQGRYGEAEVLQKRTLEARERVLGKEHPDTLISVNNLAAVYESQGRYGEAEPLYRRALETKERILGKEHPRTLDSLNNLALLYHRQHRYDEAEPLYRSTLAALERTLGPEHPDTLESLNNLAGLYDIQGRFAEAEPLYQRAIKGQERLLGIEHPNTLVTANNLAGIYRSQGRYEEAGKIYKRTLESFKRLLGEEHPYTGYLFNNLAGLYLAQGDFASAVDYGRHGVSVIVKNTQRGVQGMGQTLTGKQISEAERLNVQFWPLLKAAIRLAPDGQSGDGALVREMFQTAQWALGSEAAQSLTQMAARGAKGDPGLAALVRERQDLTAEWQQREALRNAAMAKAADKRDNKAEAANLARLSAIETTIAAIDTRLVKEFPDYAALANPQPLTVDEVQAQLGADEALVLFLDTQEWTPTPEETFIWVVTKTNVRWVRSDMGTAALTREVQALRCGLDHDAWNDEHCTTLISAGYTEDDAIKGKPLPFDLARAHGLYKALFGQVKDLVKGKHLLIVPSGPLTQLPFQVLVTAPPANGDYNFAGGDQTSIAAKTAAWFARDHAVTILPAVSSLKALRAVARPSAASKPMIGFGNPLLDGQQNHRDPKIAEYFKRRAQLAVNSQSCRESPIQQVTALFGNRGATPVETGGGLAQISHIKMQAPLPETAGELCAVARDLKADTGELRLGARATETEVKRLSGSGQLAQYRIVHFATHGALAGELKGTNEPGLIMTPPDTATEGDDGYLSASEIAGLKLDADWVILSACNTAAGEAKGARALSGLARAFIYAQARALLVSHWAVDSNATVKLITGAMRETSRNAKVGRAEALRRSMLALIDKGEAKEAHPAFWAPFIVVGEGAR